MSNSETLASSLYAERICIPKKSAESKSGIKSHRNGSIPRLNHLQQSQEVDLSGTIDQDSNLIKAAAIVGKASNEALRMLIAPIIVSAIAITGEDPLTEEEVSKKERIKAILELPAVFLPDKPVLRSAKKIGEIVCFGRKIMKAYREE